MCVGNVNIKEQLFFIFCGLWQSKEILGYFNTEDSQNDYKNQRDFYFSFNGQRTWKNWTLLLYILTS